MKKRVLIGIAWPYANNNLHVGHLAALLPGDVLARYSRLKGYETIMVSGSDMHGTPITERARKEGVSPADIAGTYPAEFVDNFEKLCFTYDLYTNPDTDYHKSTVQDFLRTIDQNGYLYETTEPQDYCEECGKFLSDREIEGKCPVCGKVTRGDQCEFCMATFDADKMTDKICRICKKPTTTRTNKHLMFRLSAFQDALTAFANESNKYVTGTVKLKLYKGNIIPAGTTSPYSLYSETLVTFDESDYDQKQAEGFINLWGLPTQVQALREQGKL